MKTENTYLKNFRQQLNDRDITESKDGEGFIIDGYRQLTSDDIRMMLAVNRYRELQRKQGRSLDSLIVTYGESKYYFEEEKK